MAALLITRQLGCGPASRPRLREIDLEIGRGQRLGLLGANGAGKTTLLQVLAGMQRPDRGEVLVDGRPLHAPGGLARHRIGFLPQRAACYPELSVRENLDWAGRLRGMDAADRKRAADRVLPQVGLQDLGARLAGRLSAGMLQRLGLAQALLHQPELLILDEPTASLDPLQAMQIRELLAGLPADTGILLATHLLDDVQALCQRVAVLEDGRLVGEHPVTAETDLLAHFRAAPGRPA